MKPLIASLRRGKGQPVRIVRIGLSDNGNWIGEWSGDGPARKIDVMTDPHAWLGHLRLMLADRRGELLFQQSFCLRTGLDELTYALIMVMPIFKALNLSVEENYGEVWGTTLAEVDETLRAHKSIVLRIADELERKGAMRSRRLAAVLAPIDKRTAPPRFRDVSELQTIAHDPLACPETQEILDPIEGPTKPK
jgi:hypothetical protein